MQREREGDAIKEDCSWEFKKWSCMLCHFQTKLKYNGFMILTPAELQEREESLILKSWTRN